MKKIKYCFTTTVIAVWLLISSANASSLLVPVGELVGLELQNETVTVAGLITGKDFKNQLKGIPLGEKLLIPRVSLRNEGDKFLDDVTIEELSKFLEKEACAVENDGYKLLDALIN